MRIHHLSCGSMCVHSKKLFYGKGGWLEPEALCCHCLLLESEEGLILVDTGLSRDALAGHSKIPLGARIAMRPVLDPDASAIRQIGKLGFKAEEVTHILVTHLDFDHAGGIADFPNAKVHIFADEYQAAMNPKKFIEKQRYVKSLWAHQPNWQIHQLQGDTWEGFAGVKALSHSDTDVLLVPMAGHTRGHSAVAVRNGEHWLLHCGDAYFYHEEVAETANCPLGLNLLQRQLAVNNKLRLENQARLRELNLRASDKIKLFCAHDNLEFNRLR